MWRARGGAAGLPMEFCADIALTAALGALGLRCGGNGAFEQAAITSWTCGCHPAALICFSLLVAQEKKAQKGGCRWSQKAPALAAFMRGFCGPCSGPVLGQFESHTYCKFWKLHHLSFVVCQQRGTSKNACYERATGCPPSCAASPARSLLCQRRLLLPLELGREPGEPGLGLSRLAIFHALHALHIHRVQLGARGPCKLLIGHAQGRAAGSRIWEGDA